MNVSNIAIPKILRIIRLHIVLGGALAFSIGVLLAFSQGGSFRLEKILFGYATIFFGDLSSHFSNDYFDVEVDSLAENKKQFGSSRILVNNPNLRLLSRNVSIALIVLSIVFAASNVFFLGAPTILLIVMLIANFLAWFYSAPPLRLVSRGFGEIVVAWVTGFVIPGVGYLSVKNQFDSVFLFLSIPFMLLGFILSLSLHVSDRYNDERTGKKNLVVRSNAKTIVFLIMTSWIIVSSTLLIYYFFIAVSSVSFGIILALLIIPLIIVGIGFARLQKNNKVTSFAASNIISLFLFNVLMIIYLILVIFSFA
jgi:1,4-dihydroxy-2-naphthoate octaprenyltransferase